MGSQGVAPIDSLIKVAKSREKTAAFSARTRLLTLHLESKSLPVKGKRVWATPCKRQEQGAVI